MNDNQITTIRKYYNLLTETKEKTYTLYSFGRVIMFDIPLEKAVEFGKYYKNIHIEEYKGG